MRLDTVEHGPGAAEPVAGAARSVSRRLYLPTIAITGLAAWLSWRGWDALGQVGIARSVEAGRFELAGPRSSVSCWPCASSSRSAPPSAVPCWPAGTCSTSATWWSTPLLVVPLIVLIGAGFSDRAGPARAVAGAAAAAGRPAAGASSRWRCSPSTPLDWLAHLGNHRITVAVAAARGAPLAGGAEHPDHLPGASAGARQLPALRDPGPGGRAPTR